MLPSLRSPQLRTCQRLAAMTEGTDNDPFYENIPVFDGFGRLMEPALYQALPDGWAIGIADIVQSTKAIRENHYKAVNMAGAAVIAALADSA